MKNKTIHEWAKIFGIEIIDNDGFDRMKEEEPVTLERFVKGAAECTIFPVDKARFAVLEDLWK